MVGPEYGEQVKVSWKDEKEITLAELETLPQDIQYMYINDLPEFLRLVVKAMLNGQEIPDLQEATSTY